jgi:hypothetical protein
MEVPSTVANATIGVNKCVVKRIHRMRILTVEVKADLKNSLRFFLFSLCLRRADRCRRNLAKRRCGYRGRCAFKPERINQSNRRSGNGA